MLKDPYLADMSASSPSSSSPVPASTLKEKLSILKAFLSKKRKPTLITAAAGALGGGLCSPVAEVRTVAFFLLIELIVLAVAVAVSKIAKARLQINRAYLQRAFSNLILGLHLTAGLVVLGVYFTL